MEAATDRISRARTHLLLDRPWFGSLALRLRLEAGGTETLSTDGTVLRYNEEYVAERSDEELKAVVAHEVMHCALLHMFRGKGRDWGQWNEATDLVINPLLRKEGFMLPAHPLEQEESLYIDMTAEQIYAARRREKEDGEDGAGPGQGQQGQGGQDGQQGQGQTPGMENWPDFQPAPDDVTNPPAEGEDRMSETDWQVAAEQAAAIAKKAGALSSELDRVLDASREARTDWRTLLRRFIEETVPSDYSWTKPNRRYIAQGLYLPGTVRENMPRIGLAIDTSGSVDQVMLKQFASELTAILHEVRPESVDVVYCDSRVKGEESFSPDDGEIVLHAKGGGGTAFQPALDHFTNHENGPPVCVIYLTDLQGPRPQEPEYPVLWAVPEQWKTPAPFGERVSLSRYEA